MGGGSVVERCALLAVERQAGSLMGVRTDGKGGEQA